MKNSTDILIKAFHLKAKENEIYVKNSRPIMVYEKRIKKLLLKGIKEIYIYGLSSSIRKAIILVQKIRQSYPVLNYLIDSNTEECVIKKNDKYEKNQKSSIVIKVFFESF
jgi:hypothetical protein